MTFTPAVRIISPRNIRNILPQITHIAHRLFRHKRRSHGVARIWPDATTNLIPGGVPPDLARSRIFLLAQKDVSITAACPSGEQHLRLEYNVCGRRHLGCVEEQLSFAESGGAQFCDNEIQWYGLMEAMRDGSAC